MGQNRGLQIVFMSLHMYMYRVTPRQRRPGGRVKELQCTTKYVCTCTYIHTWCIATDWHRQIHRQSPYDTYKKYSPQKTPKEHRDPYGTPETKKPPLQDSEKVLSSVRSMPATPKNPLFHGSKSSYSTGAAPYVCMYMYRGPPSAADLKNKEKQSLDP